MDLIKSIENEFLKEDLPSFGPGDTVKVNVKVSEGNRERIQTFEGVIIAINGVGVNKTITVRKLSFGVGVERIFPVHAPIVDSIEVIRKGKVRRSKLYYLRDRKGKSARINEKIKKAANLLQINELLKRKPSQLSGGQRQRVAIGRAITRNQKFSYLMNPYQI